ncbi:MAG TPA: TonB-dependent receptor plug domain-containing protein, partial [Opitutus sp.]|nr:TonB-dependent receptor plug domain-containing protein [Opitutus sp.]
MTASTSLAQTAAAPASGSTQQEADEAIVLTPFTVDASKDQGYFAENTLAGSRLNTNISDLGASISVVTKQQMEDTASVDVNDIFRYEVNTEGSLTYTPQQATLRNDGLLDVNAGGSFAGGVVQTNATANRVRGIGVPSSAINYYPSIGQIPMDSYNVTSLEISRGPNSMLFGMGSPAGIVNQSTAQAVLNRNSNSVSMRFDDRGSYRGTFSFNRGLIDDKFAIYGAVLYQDQQFERKPSYDITRRQYGAFTFKPFSKTVLRASVEGYSNNNRRPNTITPRDFVTEWRRAGSPMYDALTKTITRTVNGQPVTSAPFIINAGSPRANEVRAYIEAQPWFDPSQWITVNGVAKAAYGRDLNNSPVSIFGEAAATNTRSALFVPGIV